MFSRLRCLFSFFVLRRHASRATRESVAAVVWATRALGNAFGAMSALTVAAERARSAKTFIAKCYD